jgi:L-Ala-D/L-Glu epimerase
MRIKSVRSWLQNLALTRPYTIATKTVTDVQSVFFEVTLDNGITGLGAANPAANVVNETPDESYVHLQSDAIAALAGRDIRHFMRIIDEVAAAFPGKPGVLAAVDIALHDAFGKFLGVPIAAFYGQYHHALPTSVTIGIKDAAATLADAQEYKDLGFRVLKVKTGLNPEGDIERILKLREQFGDYFTIRVDANQGYTLADLRHFLQKTQQADIELIEQPLVTGGEAPLLELPWEERRLLAADESLKNARSALHWATAPLHFGIYNIKLMKCGGIRGALEIANIARQADIALFWGCNDESRVSITAAVHAAFACPHTRYLDLDGSLDLAVDGAEGGFVLENGIMTLTNGSGLGLA